ncbi:SusC/RagA family TonB-linked outer membrane protein [Siansivirga zeaxanthinifaciens]|uniref:Membrane protein n=1 Tax=Siansivirga zeaxanthinifaciens CC-SAMT-1 TaxID=1454006 RepID=A0A0C5WDK5_9FLAO|nr:TonB-dependent receptor [Siansivirga zeaxanthinifaciens]AJR04352.1 membrane protein [Siansivirga zeaxanthinifaciens CC-SAMT-1]
MNLKNKLALIAILLFNLTLFAQKNTIRGQVVSKTDNMPIPGVNIVVLKTNKGTTTDFDGGYQIEAKSGDVLQFSYIGFVTQVQIVKDKNTINISLVEDLAQLDEVVVVGYGSLKKSNITSAVSTYKNENMEQLPFSRVDQALQGKIAGVQIQNTSSAAGEDPVIRIRGQASINASPDPLVVLDGQPIEDGLSSINMADIESISVLKDASSAAIYGSRGANGVILVTTKSGSDKKTSYSFNHSIGFKSAYELYDVQTSSEYVRQLYDERELRLNDPLWDSGTVPSISIGDQKQYILENLVRGGQGTLYQDEFMRTGIFRNIGLSASGGTKKFKYRISGAYNGDESMMQKSNFDKYQFRVKLDVDLSDKLSAGVNIAPTYSEIERPANDYRDYYRFPSFIPVRHTAETLALAQSDGNFQDLVVGDYANPSHFYSLVFPEYPLPDGTTYTSTNLSNPWTTSSINPFKVLNLQDDTQEEFRVQANFYLDYKINKDLTFKTTANAYYRFSDRVQWVGTNARAETNVNYAVYITRDYRDLLSENTLNYVKDFDKHSFNALIGFSAQRTDYHNSSFTGQNFPNDNIRTWNNAGTLVNLNSSSDPGGEVKNATALLSYYGRLVYSYDGLFNLTGTFRRDGASQFGPGNKWGTFPSVSGGINLARLDFIKSSNVISKLNFRVAYGETGNNRTEPLGSNNAFNPYLNLLTNTPYGGDISIYDSTNANYVTGSGNGTQANGQATPAEAGANADLTWETTVSTNLGFDLGLFRNRVNLSAEFYESNTDKLLLTPENQLYSGVQFAWNNVGSLQNRGHEIELSTINIATENFRWTTVANYASNRLKLTDFGGLAETPRPGERGELYITEVGSPLVQFYGYKTDGVWVSQAEIDASGFTNDDVSIGTLTPGGLKLLDISGPDGVPDGKINTDDRTVIGDPYADFTWGMTNTFEYKGIDLSFSFQGVHGIEMYLGDTGYTETKSQVVNYTKNRWVSPSNPGDGQTPYETLGGVQWVQTDYGIDDASYIALRDITLGYNLDEKWSNRIGLNQLRVYVAGQNLLYLTAKDFRGLNPESRRSGGQYSSPLITGYDRGGYPVPKTIVLGFDVKF